VLPKAKELLGALPLRFEPNHGQLPPAVRFSARAGDLRVFLTAREALLRFPGISAPETIRISLVGANPSPRVEGAGPLASRSNYFLGNRRADWRLGVPHYRAVRYAAVYPGIDLVFYGAAQGLEYDFVLQPGADPGRIRMRFRGVQRLSLTPEGDLRLRAGGRELVQKTPLVYQPQAGSAARREIRCRYRLLGRGVVGVELARYDRSLPVIIDPVLVYGSFLGTSADEVITGIKVDDSGMVYVAGSISSGDITPPGGTYQESPAGGRDVFIAKLDPALSGPESLVYFTYLGGTGDDAPTCLTLDSAGSVYVAGSTASSDFPLAGSPAQNTPGGAADAFVAKLDPRIAGPFSLNYSTYLGGSEADIAYGIDVDAAGAIYVAGSTRSENLPRSSSPLQDGRWGEQDGFVAKLDLNASSVVYSTYLGGEVRDEARAVVVVSPDRIWVAGHTFSAIFPASANAFQPAYQGGGDIFLTQLDLGRPGYDALLYSTFLGGTGDDEVRRMVLDPTGRVLLTGFTLSDNFPVTPDAFQPAPHGMGTVFLARLDPNSEDRPALTYATYLGGSGGEVAYDIAADAQENVYLAGYTLSRDFPVTGDAFQPTYGGGVNVFCTRLNLAAPPAQALVYSTYIGQAGISVARGIAVAPDGVIYLAGYAQDRGFPVTDNAYQSTYVGGLSDGFVVGLPPPAPAPADAPVNATSRP